jgi:hypothetical protein
MLATIKRLKKQKDSFDPACLAFVAKRFAEENFAAEMQKVINKVLAEKGRLE